MSHSNPRSDIRMSGGGPADLGRTQRRTLGTLVGTQVLGGVGLSAGIAVGSLLAEDIANATVAGLGGTFQVLGGALIAVPMAAVMARSGRRPGLLLGYALAALGAAGLVLAAVLRDFALLLLASTLFGGGAASNSQARYAAADLALERHRGRDLSLVVWATTVGSVLGPNLIGPAEPLARALGLPVLSGPFLFSLVGFALAGLLLVIRLRPDPLVLARALAIEAGDPAVRHGSVFSGLRLVGQRPVALLGVVTMTIGHTVMVAVMVMTPLHMHHGGSTLELIGLVISLHIVGMYAFSPLVGIAVDRIGARTIAVSGAACQLVAGLLAATAPEGGSAVLAVALFLLGLGWSGTLVSGSALLVAALTPGERAGAQGGADLCMGLAGASGAALAGVVVGGPGYGVLAVLAAALCLVIPATALATSVGPVSRPVVLLVTSAALPDGEPDGQLLVEALHQKGLEGRWVAWDDPGVDWSQGLVAVRSTWDYETRREEFLAWARAVPRLLNSAEVFAWNTDKAYLVPLGAAGVPVVPTVAAEGEGDLPAAIAEVASPAGAVVKPRVGAGGRGVTVFDFVDGGPHALDETGLQPGPWVVQPLVESVRTEGEHSVFVLAGRPVSACRKRPAAGEIRVQEEYGGSTIAVSLTEETAGLARRTVAAAEQLLGERLDYARVDAMRLADGTLVVSELEITEPGLYLDVVPENAAAFADLVAERLGS